MQLQHAHLLTSLLLAALLPQADMMMRKMFCPAHNTLQTSPLAPTYKAQLLQLLSTFTMQLAQHMPTGYTLMMRLPMYVPTYNFIPSYHMQLPKIAPTGRYIAPVQISTYQMMGMALVLLTNNLQLAVSTTYHNSLQGYSLGTYMPLGLQLSAVNSSVMQPPAPSCLLLASTTYTLMRPVGFTILVAALNISLWQLRTSSSSQLFVVTYTMRLATLQLVTHLELTMQHAGYSTAVEASLPGLSASLTAQQPQLYQVAALSAFTWSSYTCSSNTWSSYKPSTPSPYSLLLPNIAAKAPINNCSSGRSQGYESEDGAAAPKRPSMGSFIKCAVLGLVNSVVNSVAAGLSQYVIKGVDFWS
jgi:hypothetical protein